MRQRVNGLTGKMNFQERRHVALQLGGTSPVDAKVPQFISKAHQALYTPSPDKFESYSQYPRPIDKPYQNQINFQSQVSVNHFLPKQKFAMSLVKTPAK